MNEKLPLFPLLFILYSLFPLLFIPYSWHAAQQIYTSEPGGLGWIR